MKFGLRYEFTWKCMYAGWICHLRNFGLFLCSYSNALNEYPISSSLSHDDCCVYPHPEKVRIQHSQTWPAFSVVEYQQVHLKFLIKFGIEPWSFEQHLGQAVFIPAGCPFQTCAFQALFYTNFNALDTHFRIIGIDQTRQGKRN
ncbi:lysine-specific demethylase JMJ26-like isoform X5 [Malus domestica]|uniref:lysine-specific demethylase JMJ26-like isoform X5 n=1 Tax=Malus domestica TaxID=3750 RepID=UPI0039765129